MRLSAFACAIEKEGLKMFKRKQSKDKTKGIKFGSSPSLLGCTGAVILVLIGIYAFLNLTEVVKWVGTPFMILPDALGIVDRPSNDEVARVSGPQGSEHVVELTRTGQYNLFRNFWDDWSVEPGEYARARVIGPSGQVQLTDFNRAPTFYDTPAGRGSVEARFVINEPGQYIVRFQSTPVRDSKTFEASLVRDYISGNETALRQIFIIQIAIILIPIGLFIYFRKIRPMQRQMKDDFKVQDQKRDSLDDFLHDLKKEK
jgi:hypothetical protein